MLFADVPATGFPWSDLAVALIGGLFSLVGVFIGIAGSFWVVSKSEAFRKLSTWEPFAASLWEARLGCFIELTERRVCIERVIDALTTLSNAFSHESQSEKIEELKQHFWQHCRAVEESFDSLFVLARTRELLIHPNITTAIVDVFEALIEFHKVAYSRMESGLGMPVDLAYDDHPLPSERELRDAAGQFKAESRRVIHLLSEALHLFHLNAAVADRFDAIARQLPLAALERLSSEVVIKPPRSRRP